MCLCTAPTGGRRREEKPGTGIRTNGELACKAWDWNQSPLIPTNLDGIYVMLIVNII